MWGFRWSPSAHLRQTCTDSKSSDRFRYANEMGENFSSSTPLLNMSLACLERLRRLQGHWCLRELSVMNHPLAALFSFLAARISLRISFSERWSLFLSISLNICFHSLFMSGSSSRFITTVSPLPNTANFVPGFSRNCFRNDLGITTWPLSPIVVISGVWVKFLPVGLSYQV